MPLENCPFCSRLYSSASLPIHLPKCSENTEKKKATPPQKRTTRRKTKKETNEERPSTRSLSRNATVSQRICFVCGQGVPEEQLESHEDNCFKSWLATAEMLSSRFITRPPRRLCHPSIDGTRDVTRQNSIAREQSRLAQSVRCRRCGAVVAIALAVDHECHQPEVQFFIPQRV